MIVLFHGDYPRHIVECDCAKTKVRVVRDLLDFLHEAVEVMSLDAVDGSDEVCGR